MTKYIDPGKYVCGNIGCHFYDEACENNCGGGWDGGDSMECCSFIQKYKPCVNTECHCYTPDCEDDTGCAVLGLKEMLKCKDYIPERYSSEHTVKDEYGNTFTEGATIITKKIDGDPSESLNLFVDKSVNNVDFKSSYFLKALNELVSVFTEKYGAEELEIHNALELYVDYMNDKG